MGTELVKFIQGTNDEPMVSSREVAAKFAKEHKEVLRAYKNLVFQDPVGDFNERNFALVEYIDAKGESRPEITMTKDGFMLLAMGFTGEEATLWKVRFIDAFNQATGSLSELRNELIRKETVILQLQNKKKRERRWLVPDYATQLPGFSQPKMVLKSTKEIKQPDLNIAKLNHLEKTMVGIERQMAALKKEIGYLARG